MGPPTNRTPGVVPAESSSVRAVPSRLTLRKRGCPLRKPPATMYSFNIFFKRLVYGHLLSQPGQTTKKISGSAHPATGTRPIVRSGPQTITNARCFGVIFSSYHMESAAPGRSVFSGGDEQPVVYPFRKCLESPAGHYKESEFDG
jgi:hypothetical protein